MFAKPQHPGVSHISRGQLNEMAWALRHVIPTEATAKEQKEMSTEIKPSFWLRYSRAMKGIDNNGEVMPLSNFSPGALQKIFEEKVLPSFRNVSKEVAKLNKKKMKLSPAEADMADTRLY